MKKGELSSDSSRSPCSLVVDTDVSSDEMQEAQANPREHQSKPDQKQQGPEHNRSEPDQNIIQPNTEKIKPTLEQLRISSPIGDAVEKRRHSRTKQDRDTPDSDTEKIKSSKIKRVCSSRDLLEDREAPLDDLQYSAAVPQILFSAKKSESLSSPGRPERSLERRGSPCRLGSPRILGSPCSHGQTGYRGVQTRNIYTREECSGEQNERKGDPNKCSKDQNGRGSDKQTDRNEVQSRSSPHHNKEKGVAQSVGKEPAPTATTVERVPKETDQQLWEKEKNVVFTKFGIRKRQLQASEQKNTQDCEQRGAAEETTTTQILAPTGEGRAPSLHSKPILKTKPLKYTPFSGIQKSVNNVDPHYKQPSQNRPHNSNMSNQLPPSHNIDNQSTDADLSNNVQSTNGHFSNQSTITQPSSASTQPKTDVGNDDHHDYIIDQLRRRASEVKDLTSLSMTMEINLGQIDEYYRLFAKIQNYVRRSQSATNKGQSIISVNNLVNRSEHETAKETTPTVVQLDSVQARLGQSSSSGFSLSVHSQAGSAENDSKQKDSCETHEMGSSKTNGVTAEDNLTDGPDSVSPLTKDASCNRSNLSNSQMNQVRVKTAHMCTQTEVPPRGSMWLLVEESNNQLPLWTVPALPSLEAACNQAATLSPAVTDSQSIGPIEKVPIMVLTQTRDGKPDVFYGVCASDHIEKCFTRKNPLEQINSVNARTTTTAGSAHNDPVIKNPQDSAPASSTAPVAANNAIPHNAANIPKRVNADPNSNQSIVAFPQNWNEMQRMIFSSPQMMQALRMPLHMYPNHLVPNPLNFIQPNMYVNLYPKNNTVRDFSNYRQYLMRAKSKHKNTSKTQEINNNFPSGPAAAGMSAANMGQQSQNTNDPGIHFYNAIVQNLMEADSVIRNTNQSCSFPTNVTQSDSLERNTTQSSSLQGNTNHPGSVPNSTQIGSMPRIGPEACLMQRNIPHTGTVYMPGPSSGSSTGPCSVHSTGRGSGHSTGPGSGQSTGPGSGHSGGPGSEQPPGPGTVYVNGPSSGLSAGLNSRNSTGPGFGHSTGPSTKNMNGPVSGHSTGPGSGHSTGPGSGLSTGLGSGHMTGPSSGSSTGPCSVHSTGPGSGHSTGPGSGHPTGPNSGHSNGLGSGYSTGPGTACMNAPSSGLSAGLNSGHSAGLNSGHSTGLDSRHSIGVNTMDMNGHGSGQSTGPGSGHSTGTCSRHSTGPGSGQSTRPGTVYMNAPVSGHPTGPNSGHSNGPGSGYSTGPGTVCMNAPSSGHSARLNSEHSTGFDSRHAIGPSTMYMNGPVSGHSTGPGSGHSTGPGSGHSTGPGSGHSTGPGSGYSTGPGAGHSTGPGSGPSTGPGSGPSNGPGSEHSTGPGSGHSTGPGTMYMNGPVSGHSTGTNSRHSNGPGSGHSTRPGTVYMNGPGSVYTTGPGTMIQSHNNVNQHAANMIILSQNRTHMINVNPNRPNMVNLYQNRRIPTRPKPVSKRNTRTDRQEVPDSTQDVQSSPDGHAPSYSFNYRA